MFVLRPLTTIYTLQLNIHCDFNNNMNHISPSSIKFRSVIISMLCFQDCQFTKIKDNTTLRVAFQGNIHVGGCSGCCKRWFITFNGAECSGPLPIDAMLNILNSNAADYRHGAIEGYCHNINKGNIRVGINIGNCPGYGNSNGYTGWLTVSRLIIEEVPRSQ